MRRRRYPDGIVTYIIDRNINYTNVCVTACKFCAFYRAPKHERGLVAPDRGDPAPLRRGGRSRRHPGDAPGRPPPRLRRRVLRGAVLRGQGGLPAAGHPLDRAERDPAHGQGLAVSDRRRRSAGSRPPGWTRSPAPAPRCCPTGRVKAIAPLKESGARWLEVMEIAHRLGRRVDRDHDDGHRRDQRRADRAPADDPRRAGPHRRLPLLHPVDLPAGEQPPQGAHPGHQRWSTCA